MRKISSVVPRFWHIALAACAQACMVAAPAHVATVAGATTVVVVRHAEKSTDDPRDPSLSAAGEERARTLSSLLKDAGVTDIVQSLSGSAVPPIKDAEYDHIFVVVIPASGSPRLMQLRFGSPGP